MKSHCVKSILSQYWREVSGTLSRFVRFMNFRRPLEVEKVGKAYMTSGSVDDFLVSIAH